MKINKKGIASLLLAGTIVTSTAGCNSNNNKYEDSSSETYISRYDDIGNELMIFMPVIKNKGGKYDEVYGYIRMSKDGNEEIYDVLNDKVISLNDDFKKYYDLYYINLIDFLNSSSLKHSEEELFNYIQDNEISLEYLRGAENKEYVRQYVYDYSYINIQKRFALFGDIDGDEILQYDYSKPISKVLKK